MIRRRRTAVVLAVVLGASVLPVLGPAPAQAAAGCLSDAQIPLLDMGCDDTTPPDTSIVGTVPVVNRAGWANKRTIRIAFSGKHTDADTDPIGFECRLSTSAAVPTEEQWDDCPEDGVYRELDQSAAVPYVFWVRAIDTADAAITWDDWTTLFTTDEPAADVDPTPARLVFRVDSIVPNTYIFGTPYDPLTPQAPMVATTSPQVQLTADEVASYVCTVDRKPVPCAEGTTTLRNLSPGTKLLRVQAVDLAGNIDPSPATTTFTVPANLRAKAKAKEWKTQRASGFIGNDYVVATQRHAELTFRATGFQEVRLLASTGPRAGVVKLKIGATWHRVNLRRTTSTKHDQIQVLDELSRRRSGTIRVRVVSNGKPVQLDGILAR